MLITCLTYLCYDAVGEDLDKEQLQDNLLSGKYRLQVFASSSWFSLALRYLRLAQNDDRHEVINGLMQNLFSELANPNFQNDTGTTSGTVDSQETADPDRLLWPGAAEFLSETVRFHDHHDKDGWTSNNGKSRKKTTLYLLTELRLPHPHENIKKNEMVTEISVF